MTAARRFWRDYLEIAVLAAVALGVAFWLGTTMCPDRPSCRTEDACAADYRDGAWHIVEVTP